MSERIPQSVAKRVVFRAFLSSDHVTLATGKTIAITISKNGAAFGNPAAGATNATEIASGFYYFDLGVGDTGTLGPLGYRGAEGTIDDVGDVYSVTDEVTALQTSVNDLPTNAELATALGTADDATLAAIAALPTATQNADALLNRDMSAVTVTNARSPINALRWLRNRWSNSGGTLTVYAEDDTTTAWTATTTTAASDPVDSVDPA
jgi:hypothetical protein